MTASSEGLVNLGLALGPVDPKAPAGKQSEVARVYVQLACSYLSGQGAPTITKDCRSLAEFENEIERLKAECDVILVEARSRLSGAAGTKGKAKGKGKGKAGAQAPRPDGPSEKTPLQVANELLVEDRMTRDVRFMRRNDKLSVAHELMQVGGFRHVVVLEDDDDRLAGVVSHRDIFFSALAWATGRGGRMHEQTLDQVPAKEVMSTNPSTVTPNTPLRDAAAVLLEEKIGCLPVVEGDQVVGILTEGDFLSLVTSATQS